MTKNTADPDTASMPEMTMVQTPIGVAPYAREQNGPFIYFDSVSAIGFLPGIAELTLEARRLRCDDNTNVARERVMVAHLRCSAPALKDLRTSIDKLLLMAEQTPTTDPTTAPATSKAMMN